MLAPSLIPDSTRSGLWSSRPVTATCTQSVGVPFRYRKPLAATRTDSGRSSVSEFDAPLRSRSGAMTVTSPNSRATSASASIPGEK